MQLQRPLQILNMIKSNPETPFLLLLSLPPLPVRHLNPAPHPWYERSKPVPRRRITAQTNRGYRPTVETARGAVDDGFVFWDTLFGVRPLSCQF